MAAEDKQILEGPGGLRIEEDFSIMKHPPKEFRDKRAAQAREGGVSEGAKKAADQIDAGATKDPSFGKKSGAANALMFHSWDGDDQEESEDGE